MSMYKYLKTFLLYGSLIPCTAFGGERPPNNFQPENPFNAPRLVARAFQPIEYYQTPFPQTQPFGKDSDHHVNLNIQISAPAHRTARTSQSISTRRQNLDKIGTMFQINPQLQSYPLVEGMSYNLPSQSNHPGQQLNQIPQYFSGNNNITSYNNIYYQQPDFQNYQFGSGLGQNSLTGSATVQLVNPYQGEMPLNQPTWQTTPPDSLASHNNLYGEQLRLPPRQLQSDPSLVNNIVPGSQLQTVSKIKVTEYPPQQLKFLTIRLSTEIKSTISMQSVERLIFPVFLKITANTLNPVAIKDNSTSTGYVSDYISYTVKFKSREDFFTTLDQRISLNENFIIDRSKIPLQFKYSLGGSCYRGKDYTEAPLFRGSFNALSDDLTKNNNGNEAILEAIRLSIDGKKSLEMQAKYKS